MFLRMPIQGIQLLLLLQSLVEFLGPAAAAALALGFTGLARRVGLATAFVYRFSVSISPQHSRHSKPLHGAHTVWGQQYHPAPCALSLCTLGE